MERIPLQMVSYKGNTGMDDWLHDTFMRVYENQHICNQTTGFYYKGSCKQNNHHKEMMLL